MIDLIRIKEVYLFSGVTDFRKGITGLYRIINDSFDANQIKESLFLFCNKKKDSIKIIEVLDTGIWLYQKRLYNGKFIYPELTKDARITPNELKIIISGLDFIHELEYKELHNQ